MIVFALLGAAIACGIPLAFVVGVLYCFVKGIEPETHQRGLGDNRYQPVILKRK